MKVVLCLALLCFIGGIIGSCPNSGTMREAYCNSVFAFKATVTGDLGANNNYYIYSISPLLKDFKNLLRYDATPYQYAFVRLYLDKDCNPLDVNETYVMIGDEKSNNNDYLVVADGLGETKQWDTVGQPLKDWLKAIPSCPRP